MLKYVISVLMMMLTAFFGYAAITKSIADKMRIFSILGSGDIYESKNVTKTERIIITAIVAVLSFFASLRLFMQVDDTINIIRILLIFVPVVCAGCIDYREKRIPNIISLYLFCEGIVFLVIEFICNRDEFESYAVSCLLSFAACFILLSLVGLITGKGIGSGDIKLLSTLGLVGGVYMICGTVIVATVICAVVAFFLLITKKKSLKSSLPFGPFISVGFFVAVIANFY